MLLMGVYLKVDFRATVFLGLLYIYKIKRHVYSLLLRIGI
jgi:hypothetical protein